MLIPELRWVSARAAVLIAAAAPCPERVPDGFYPGDRLRCRGGVALLSSGRDVRGFRYCHGPFAALVACGTASRPGAAVAPGGRRGWT